MEKKNTLHRKTRLYEPDFTDMFTNVHAYQRRGIRPPSPHRLISASTSSSPGVTPLQIPLCLIFQDIFTPALLPLVLQGRRRRRMWPAWYSAITFPPLVNTLVNWSGEDWQEPKLMCAKAKPSRKLNAVLIKMRIHIFSLSSLNNMSKNVCLVKLPKWVSCHGEMRSFDLILGAACLFNNAGFCMWQIQTVTLVPPRDRILLCLSASCVGSAAANIIKWTLTYRPASIASLRHQWTVASHHL